MVDPLSQPISELRVVFWDELHDTAAMRRRSFLHLGAAAGAPLILPRRVVGGGDEPPPSETVNLAGVGIGGMGGAYLDNLSSQNVVALADVDSRKAARVFDHFPKATRYEDFRVLLEKEKHIDGVVIGTPDHTHAVIALAAMDLGKHVYCAKPLTRTIAEARKVTRRAGETSVATQMSIQWNAKESHRVLAEWIAGGAIGDVTEVHTWSNRPIWPQGLHRPKDTPLLPPHLRWDLWLGPAPLRPYHPAYHPFKWRGWWDFGCGALGDMGCHHFDPIFRSLKLTAPVSVVADTSELFRETAPKSATITYEFPARGDWPPVKVVWYDGGRKPERPDELEEGRKMSDAFGGTLYVGSRGKILTGGLADGVRIIPEEKMKAYTRPKPTLPRSPGHYQEFIHACKGGPPAGADFAYGGPLTEAVLLGNVAIRAAGRRLEWDAKSGEVTNLPGANRFLQADYRRGW